MALPHDVDLVANKLRFDESISLTDAGDHASSQQSISIYSARPNIGHTDVLTAMPDLACSMWTWRGVRA